MNEIQSVSRAFAIIEYLSMSEKTVALKNIASACELPPPTAHRILNTLCSLGYVVHEENGQYRLSLKLFEISSRAVSRSSLISIAKPYLDALSERLGESIHLVVRDGTDIIYVYKVTHAVGSIQMASRIGMRLPMYCVAVGKAIMAAMSDPEIAAVFQASNIVAVTPKTITTLPELIDQISQIRRQGYAIDDEENEIGVKCIATALGRSEDSVSYAFSVSSIKQRMTEQRIMEIAPLLLETKKQIERQLFFN